MVEGIEPNPLGYNYRKFLHNMLETEKIKKIKDDLQDFRENDIDILKTEIEKDPELAKMFEEVISKMDDLESEREERKT